LPAPPSELFGARWKLQRAETNQTRLLDPGRIVAQTVFNTSTAENIAHNRGSEKCDEKTLGERQVSLATIPDRSQLNHQKPQEGSTPTRPRAHVEVSK
jgi:hypothetical protein